MTDVIRLGKLFTALHSSNEGERSAAATLLHNWMINNRVHPDDLVLDVKGEREARIDRIMKRFEEENRKLRRENDFFQAHADPKLRTKAQKAALVENRWGELAALICQRLAVKTLPARGWQEPVQQVTGASKAQLQKWRSGLVAIPDTAFDKIRTVSTLVATQRPPLARKSSRQNEMQCTQDNQTLECTQ